MLEVASRKDCYRSIAFWWFTEDVHREGGFRWCVVIIYYWCFRSSQFEHSESKVPTGDVVFFEGMVREAINNKSADQKRGKTITVSEWIISRYITKKARCICNGYSGSDLLFMPQWGDLLSIL
ncbi:uncharacterized protein LOC124665920 [Lolium rigidum]|uniref:uncharacterized protein LOC124665920 n=1 Tax=Lolium rigidum TaxID=89674 RepID=UPI001F5DE218|nr:uncharacterized protein LOC124665920 [Lolium rigidum]